MTINARSTKAQLLQYIQDLEACQAVADQQVLQLEADLRSQNPTIQDRASVVWEEFKALCSDTYRLGAWCRKGFDQVLAELRLIVN